MKEHFIQPILLNGVALYESMKGAEFYGFGNHVPISSWSFLIDTLVTSVAKEQIYAVFVVRSMSVASNKGRELQSSVLFFLRYESQSVSSESWVNYLF